MSRFELLEKYRSIWRLLPRPFGWAAVALVAGSVAGTVLEVLGIALLGLLLGELGSGAAASRAHFLPVPDFLGGAGDPDGRIKLILVLCAIVFFAKNALLAFHAWLEATFAFRVQAWVSNRLVEDALRLDYEDAVKRSPSEYTVLLTADVVTLANYTILPALTLLSELVLVAGIFLFLVTTQTVVTLAVAAVLLPAGLAIVATSRSMVSHVGARRQVLEDWRSRTLQQSFANLRDVYVYGAAPRLHHRLQTGMSELARVYRVYSMMAGGPRFVLEFCMVAVLLGLLAAGLKTHDRGALVASVGVFAASGFRLLIGTNRLIMSLQAMRFGDAAFERVNNAISKTAPVSASAGPSRDEQEGQALELRASGLTYSHGNSPAIGPVDLEIRRGEMIGLVGASGVGKSTVLELLAGLRHPGTGRIELLDAAGQRFLVPGPGPRITLVGQSAAVMAESLRENIAFGRDAGEAGDDELWEALRLAQLEAFARALPLQLDTPLAEFGGSLSGGQLQRIGIARALWRHSSFILLDEPTSALDPATEAELVRMLRQITHRCGILLVSHRPEPLAHCDRIYELHSGGLRLVRGQLVARAA